MGTRLIKKKKDALTLKSYWWITNLNEQCLELLYQISTLNLSFDVTFLVSHLWYKLNVIILIHILWIIGYILSQAIKPICGLDLDNLTVDLFAVVLGHILCIDLNVNGIHINTHIFMWTSNIFTFIYIKIKYIHMNIILVYTK